MTQLWHQQHVSRLIVLKKKRGCRAKFLFIFIHGFLRIARRTNLTFLSKSGQYSTVESRLVCERQILPSPKTSEEDFLDPPEAPGMYIIYLAALYSYVVLYIWTVCMYVFIYLFMY